MNFPDRNHFLQLRKELWQRPLSRASVMVGAGFSLNARPAPGVDTPFPTWRPLTRAMFKEIYPPTGGEITDWEDRFNRSNPLRIASEYEAAFKRQKLESFIRSHVPDSGHHPGPIHELLLQLPWRDVFTTNYDTLLERTEVTGRAYQPVTTIEDLTSAVPPRIIKLHGTLPSQSPFIVTEEDYRTYPRRFSPFVNTVRQALIENSFVLIGFSGDDPNFLEWIGWIRDELDDHHAPIYLTGVLSLDGVQRSLLAKRGVTPIDLTPLFPRPSDSLGPAIQWVLKSLMMGRPPSARRWPKGNTITQEDSDYQPALLVDGLNEPEAVSVRGSSQDLDEETAWSIIKRWAFERARYPGWLVPAEQIRSTLWGETERLIMPLIEFSKNRSPADRILIFYELNWRMEVSMMPLFDNTKEPFEATLDDLFPGLHEAGTVDPPSVEPCSIATDVGIREAWLEIAFALLREAREMYDTQRWNRFKEQIDKVVPAAPKFADRCHYEHALWMMWNIRRPEAKDVLESWSPSPQAALASMQKAGLLVELDAVQEAESLLRSALRHIRRSIYSAIGTNIYLLSLEGWCMYLLYRIGWMLDHGIREPGLYDNFYDRWQELKTWNCSPWPLLEYFDSVLTEDPPGPSQSEKTIPGFDPGSRKVNRHISNAGMRPWLPAFACIRLYEQVGIPVRFSGKELSNACAWVVQFNSFWSPALLIVAGKIDKLIEQNLLDRTQVANMKPDVAANIHRWAMDAVKREQAVLAERVALGSHLGELLNAIIEVLSRLTIRLGFEEIQDAFVVALKVHAEPGIYSHRTLHDSCQFWLKRLLYVANDSQIRAWLPELIRFPLPDQSKVSAGRIEWKDPIEEFPIGRLPQNSRQDADNVESIGEAVAWLQDQARSESGEGWRRAVMRLIRVHRLELMTSEQEAEMGSILWKHLAGDGFPDLPQVFRSEFHHLPAPPEIAAKDKIRTWLLDGIPRTSVSVKAGGSVSVGLGPPDAIILELAVASRAIVHVPFETKGFVEWTWEETKACWSKINEWWQNDKRGLESRSLFGADGIVATASSAGVFLRRAVLPEMKAASDDEWKEVLGFLEDARRHGVFLSSTWPYVLIHRPSESSRVAEIVIGDLSSDVEDAVVAGAEAVSHWIHLATAGVLESPPEQVVDAVLHRVVFRRPIGAAACLQHVAILVREQPEFFDSRHFELLISCLIPWVESIRVPIRDGRDGDFREYERPDLRVFLGRLASALSRWVVSKPRERPEPNVISHLREVYGSDRLPEVRRSLDERSW